MPALAMLSPIKEADELSPYYSSFRHGRYQTQKSPIAVTKTPVYYVREAAMPSPVSGDQTIEDLWIYDCYVAEDATSLGEYPRSPSSPAASHRRSVSLPSTTASYSPVITVPIVQEPTPVNSEVAPDASYAGQPAPTYNVSEASEEETAYGPLPVITTSVSSPGMSAEYPEYSPLEQEAIPIWEVIDQLADSADCFAGLETLLSEAGAAECPPAIDGDVAFWMAEGLNMLVGDYIEVARELLEFNEFVEQMLAQDQQAVASRPAATVRHASFSEQDSKEVLAQAAKLSSVEVQKELAALEASTPRSGRNGKRPPSLKLSTDDAVLLQAIRPRSRLQSVGALNRFSDDESQSRLEMLRKHRVYAVYGEETPVDDNCSIKSIVDYDAIEPMDEVQDAAAPGAPRPRPTSGQSMMPRPLSSPVTFAGAGRSAGRRPPSLTLTDPNIEQASQHSVSSSVSSLFSSLPRSSVTADSSPRSSPRQSLFDGKGDKQRFPTASGNIKKMFSNLFKKRESARSSMRPFAKRTGAPGSVDATLSALSLSGPTSNSSTPPPLGLGTEVDPFAASPPPPLRTPPPNQAHTRSASEASPLDGYSSLFNPVKAASKYPPQPLFGEPTP